MVRIERKNNTSAIKISILTRGQRRVRSFQNDNTRYAQCGGGKQFMKSRVFQNAR